MAGRARASVSCALLSCICVRGDHTRAQSRFPANVCCAARCLCTQMYTHQTQRRPPNTLYHQKPACGVRLCLVCVSSLFPCVHKCVLESHTLHANTYAHTHISIHASMPHTYVCTYICTQRRAYDAKPPKTLSPPHSSLHSHSTRRTMAQQRR